MRLNSPDGWMPDQGGPAWFLSTDTGPQAPAWTGYGFGGYSTNGYGAREYGNRPVSEDALSGAGILPAITRATTILVGPVVGTTWRYYQQAPGIQFADVRQGEELIGRPLWTVDPQLFGSLPGGDQDRPTLPRPLRVGPVHFWETLLTHALWWGIGALLYVEDAAGQPLAGTLRVVNPTRWGWTNDGRFVLDPDGEDPLESDYEGGWDIGPVRWTMKLLHGFSPVDGDTAQGALVRSGLVLYAGERLNSYLGSVLGTGVPSGVLKVSTPNFGEDDAALLKQRWMAAHGGVKKSVAVLNAGVDFQGLQLSLVDSDLVRAKGAWLVDLAHAFTLSAAWLDTSTGTGSNLTYANLGERRRDLLDHSLAVPARHLEDLISAVLPYGTAMRVDWSGYLNTDPNEALRFVEQGLANGYLSEAEARDRLGLRPHPDASTELAGPPATTTTTAAAPPADTTTGGPVA